MRFLSLNNLEANMCLARPIYGDDGRILLNTGVTLTEHYIHRLKELGSPGAYVTDQELLDIEFPETISIQTRQRAIKHVHEVFESVQIGKTFEVKGLQASVKDIIDEIALNPNVLVSLADIRSLDGYTFAHSVNVCVLSAILGMKFQLNELELYDLAMGAILHDIGKIVVPEQILLKPGPLTTEQMEEMRRHTFYGWQLLKNHPELSLLSAHVAYQHHERPNGQGYPRNLLDEQMELYAKIVCVADAYDAMTSKRIYRPGLTPAEALNVIHRLRGIQFNPEVADRFIESVAPYPVGSMVTLNTGEVGMVADVNQIARDRPIIRLLYDAEGNRITSYKEVDLVKELHLKIVE